MKNKITLRLKQRDLAILRLLYEHRFLSAELLWYLIKSDSQLPFVGYSLGADGKSRPITYGFKKQALSKRLKQLFDAGYVARHFITDQPMGRGYGTPRAIYALGSNSSKVLLESDKIPLKTTRRIIQSNNVKSPFLRHTLDLARFKVAVILACRKSHQRVKLVQWNQDESIKVSFYLIGESGTKEKVTVHADASFAFEMQGRKRRHYYLEIDRGTEPIVSSSYRSSIRRKLIGYQEYYKSIRRRKNENNGFQVLFVTPGQIQPGKTPTGRIVNILSELNLSNYKFSPKSLFLLTTHDSYCLGDPQSIFGDIWLSRASFIKTISLVS